MENHKKYRERSNYWIKQSEELVKDMRRSIASKSSTTVNLSVYKHHVITLALRAVAYDRELEGEYLKIIFNDGSQPTQFPCGVLRFDDKETPKNPVDIPKEKVTKIGLMSLRHPEMDYLVDFYAIENREIAMLDSTAAEELLAYDTTLNLLNSPELQDGGEVWVYHTGLEPVIIGFYRAVTAILSWRQEQGSSQTLVFRPWVYRAATAKTTRYDPKSPGASEFDYSDLPCWC